MLFKMFFFPVYLVLLDYFCTIRNILVHFYLNEGILAWLLIAEVESSRSPVYVRLFAELLIKMNVIICQVHI